MTKVEFTYQYSGLLYVDDLAIKRGQIEAEALKRGVPVRFYESLVEIEYDGRDYNRFVRDFLGAIAPVVGTAEGEVAVERSGTEGEDPTFEFYAINGGRLQMQPGRIVRGDWVVVV